MSAGRRDWRLVRARRDAIPTSVRRFMQRSRRHRLRSVAPWSIVTLVVVLAVGAAVAVYHTDLFAVRDVRVVGASLVSADQVRAAAAIRRGVPLARVDLTKIRDRVAKLPPVAQVGVTRDWPHTVVVRVVERTAVAVVPQGGAYVVVDAEGVVFRRLAARPSSLPLVETPAPGPEDAATAAALRVLAALTPQLRQQLVKVSAPTSIRIQLRLAKNRIIVWGDAEDSGKKARVATALLARPGTVIDVSAPEVVTVR